MTPLVVQTAWFALLSVLGHFHIPMPFGSWISLRQAIEHHQITFDVAALATTVLVVFRGVVGSGSLPHLDEGATWARAAPELCQNPIYSQR
jgi:hypothetical protein